MKIVNIILFFIQLIFISNRIDEGFDGGGLYKAARPYYDYYYDYGDYNGGGSHGNGGNDDCKRDKCDDNPSKSNIVSDIILSGLEKGAEAIKNKAGTIRFTKNGKISPKYYKNGWLGGSKAKIKTYKLGKFGKFASKGLKIIDFGTSAYNIGSSFAEDGVKCGIKTTIKELISFGGSALGSLVLPGIGTVIGGYLGDKLGEKITEE